MDVLDLVTQQLNNPDAVNQLSSSVNAQPSQVEQVAKIAVPMLMQALNRNASTPEGARSLAGALDEHRNDPVENVPQFLRNVDTNDGTKILEHVLGNKKERVQRNLAGKTGLDMGQIASLLVQLAPLILGTLAKKKQQENLDADRVPDMTSDAANRVDRSSGGIMDMVNKYLDSDNDGSIVDDLGNILGGFGKR